MSIMQIISTLVGKGDLTPYVPRSRRDAERRLYLTREARSDLESQYSSTNLVGLRGQIESALTLWTLNERIYSNDGGEASFLKRLDPPPPDIWTIRITEADIQARLFGRFIEPDTLILTKFYPRGHFSKKLRRGQKKTPQQKKKEAKKWRQAMNECEAAWRQLFPNGELCSGSIIADYVTENCDDFPI